MSIPKTYTSRPERIGRNEDTEKLYELEAKITEAIDAVVEWRVENLGESHWTYSLPQTLRMILDSYDTNASKVASKSYLSNQEENITEEEKCVCLGGHVKANGKCSKCNN